jgi:hypothetical protein
MMDDVRNGIFREVRAGESIGIHRRYLQRAYIDEMNDLMSAEVVGGGWFGPSVNVGQSDIKPIVRNQLVILQRDITRRLNAGNIDRATRVHLEDAQSRIDDILNPDN